MAKERTYLTTCVSLYYADEKRLNLLVAKLQAKGYTGTSRSDVIRYALRNLDPETVPDPEELQTRLTPQGGT